MAIYVEETMVLNCLPVVLGEKFCIENAGFLTSGMDVAVH